MLTKKLFLASSKELAEDRKEFALFVQQKNTDWAKKGAFIELIVWEDFLDAVSKTRLQDEYNQAIRGCDLFVMLFFTKVGQYTEEEFETAFGQFQATNKPFIFTYFKDAEITTGSADKKDLMSLWAFQEKLKALGHFCPSYRNIDDLKFKFNRQLDKLAAQGFIEFHPEEDEADRTGGDRYEASLVGSGAIAQGPGAQAAGERGVVIGGANTADINTGTRIDTGGGAYFGGSVQAGGDVVGRDRISPGDSPAGLEPLFARLVADVAQLAPVDRKAEAAQKVRELQAEAARGRQADDDRLARMIDGLVALVPGSATAVVELFANPILAGLSGRVTRFVLDKLKAS